jgi:glucose/arabinose dehydrogenase
MLRRILLSVGFALVVLALFAWLGLHSSWGERLIVESFSKSYATPKGDLAPTFDGKDAQRKQLRVQLSPVATGFTEPTDVQFFPGQQDIAIVLEKGGRAYWVSLADGQRGQLLQLEVLKGSEQGLLGMAFHPDFQNNGKFYLNYVTSRDDDDVSRLEEWRVVDPLRITAGQASAQRVVFEIEQPYPNHNAGQLAFGPDGYLYVGWGDGGAANDPLGAGQDPGVFLGKMLRIDVDRSEGGRAYSIPEDNPFIGRQGYLPEIWALGLRNPWRYSFDDVGRLIVADVGQNRWEEIDIVEAGDNLGWKVMEGLACFSPDVGCPTEGLTKPIYVYGRDDGLSITGGYVYRGERIAALRGRYVFGDFVTGRLWAIDLPQEPQVVEATSLGRWPILVSSFGRDVSGELYVLAHGRGMLLRLDPAD